MAATPYDYNVFINCPFDWAYRPILYALVFAVHDCGFRARSTLEIDDSGAVRIENIYGLILESRFGINDISRTELGVFLGAARFGRGRQREKRSLILDREPFRYQKYLSDIAGQDIRSHGGDPEEAIGRVRDWLDSSPVEPEVIRSGGAKIAERYRAFMRELPDICGELHLNPEELTFNNFTTFVVEWLKVRPV